MLTDSPKGPYTRLFDALRFYWRSYGGLKAILGSPFFHASLLLTAVTFRLWMPGQPWYDMVIGVMPNLLGFTIGGFAIFLAFGDEKFRALIAGSDNGTTSPFLNLCVTFLHFVLIQMATLIVAICGKALAFDLPDYLGGAPVSYWFGTFFGAIGFGLFLYSITLGAAAGMAIFRAARYFDAFQSKKQ
jgi:hypothetical protein